MAAALLTACIASAAAGQTVKAGIAAWQAGEYAAAVDIWKPLATKGDADAAFNLGQAYRLGRGVPIDLSAAQRWLEQASRKGHLDAQATLGLLLFENGNRTGGLRWLRQAAERGEPRALLVYGTALFNGDGLPADPVLAYAYVSRAAAQGLAPAKTTLAEMDQIMPVEQRQKGVAIAIDKAATANPGPPAKAKPTASKAPARSTPSKAAAGEPGKARGNWRIQLGAFSKRASAEALFKRVSGASALAGRQPHYDAAGSVTRLQVGPFESRSAAASACAALKAQACFPVEGR